MAPSFSAAFSSSPNHGHRRPPMVLSIAGTDPIGGAGAQADIKAISESGGYALSVITAVLAQNTRGVSQVLHPGTQMLIAQLDAVFADVTPDAVKIGMLGDAETVATVAGYLREHPVPLVVLDPVMVSSSGHRLLDDEAVHAVRALASQADVITPNLEELAVLATHPGKPRTEAPTTFTQALDLGVRVAVDLDTTVIVKGGHLQGDRSDNAVVTSDGVHTVVASRRIATTNTHGTGCSLSSSLTTRIAGGDEIGAALSWATSWLSDALTGADALNIGHGNGPVDHTRQGRRLRAAGDTSVWPIISDIPAFISDPERIPSTGNKRAPLIPAAGTWSAGLWRLGQAVTDEILSLEFITSMASGELKREDFLFYLAQDAHYLKHYSRALAMLAARAATTNEQVQWAQSAAECLTVEADLHRQQVGGHASSTEPTPVTQSYTDFLSAAVTLNDYVVGACAVLPCYWLYAEVGLQQARGLHHQHPYYDWLAAYSAPEFAQSVTAAIGRVERALASATPAQRSAGARAYIRACHLEREFFMQALTRVRP